MAEPPIVRVHEEQSRTQSRWLPEPWTSLAVFATWVLLSNSLHPATLLMAAALALLIPLFSHPFLPMAPRIHAWGPLLRFVPVFLYDIVVANLSVAALILRFGRQPRPAWLVVPLDAREPFAISAFAAVISLTPGTVSSVIAPDRRSLLVHGLDVDDPDALIAELKARYEAPLRRIFEP